MAYNYGLAPGTTHKVSPSGSSAAASTAFNADTVFVRIVATAAMNIAFAATPTAAATDLYIPAATVEILKFLSRELNLLLLVLVIVTLLKCPNE